MTTSARIELMTSRQENNLLSTISDNGPGIDVETQKRIFEPFFTTKDVGLGTGLGLSVSYFIITESHLGQLNVESAPNEGARFNILLPISNNPQQG
ncbi:MAG: ATP-binding protein [Geopsychrobacter sp.]|nr:ATP-binding protein [Geopsychrobacter sp.]